MSSDRLPTIEAIDAQSLLALAFENSPLGMTISSVAPPRPGMTRHHAFMVNRAFVTMLGYSVEDLLSAEDQSKFTHKDDRASDLANLQDLLSGRDATAHWDKRYIHADGRIVWGRVYVSLLRSADGAPRYLVAQIEDVTERHAREIKLLERAERDALTGLWNRAAFEEHAEEQIARTARYGEQAALLVIDLDDLKQINDEYGHVAGDHALVRIADTLRSRLRTADVASRIGGDEFVVLLPHTDRREADRIAEDIEQAIGTTKFVTGKADLSISVSIGSTEISAGDLDIEPALAAADRDMYRAKRRHQEPGVAS